MYESLPRWQSVSPSGTFVQAQGSAFGGFEPERAYRVAALRRVTHPSLAQILDRAVTTASAVEGGRLGQDLYSTQLYRALIDIPSDHRTALAQRRPEALIPFLGTAARVLAPLQLVAPVRCVRLYDASMPGELAQRLYGEAGVQKQAPEPVIMPGEPGYEHVSLRYMDFLRGKASQRWPASQLVLISNARVQGGTYLEQDRESCEQLVRLAVGLPRLTPKVLQRLPEVPPGHFDWGIALIMWASSVRH